jgi:multidrug resistance efflux pump
MKHKETTPENEATESDATAPSAEIKKKARNPVRRFTWILLTIIALLFVWYLVADRVTPWTDQARVQAWIVPITPKVSGKVKKVMVERDQFVKAGDLLAVIDPEKYEIAVERAEAALELAGQAIGAGTAAVSAAQAKVVEANAKLDEYKILAARIEKAAAKGAVAAAQADSSRAEVTKAEAQVKSAEAELERAKQELGVGGKENPKMRDALAALRQARINLADTKIHAPADGGITNLKIEQGYYAKAGVPLMTFVSFQEDWIEANFRENSIGNIKVGDPVEFVLDMAPGEVHRGTIGSIGFAVKDPSNSAAGEAITVKAHSGWLRDAQRFPVTISLENKLTASGKRFAGGQADVQVYTQEANGLMKGLGKLWIRILSRCSYAY